MWSVLRKVNKNLCFNSATWFSVTVIIIVISYIITTVVVLVVTLIYSRTSVVPRIQWMYSSLSVRYFSRYHEYSILYYLTFVSRGFSGQWASDGELIQLIDFAILLFLWILMLILLWNVITTFLYTYILFIFYCH